MQDLTLDNEKMRGVQSMLGNPEPGRIAADVLLDLVPDGIRHPINEDSRARPIAELPAERRAGIARRQP